MLIDHSPLVLTILYRKGRELEYTTAKDSAVGSLLLLAFLLSTIARWGHSGGRRALLSSASTAHCTPQLDARPCQSACQDKMEDVPHSVPGSLEISRAVTSAILAHLRGASAVCLRAPVSVADPCSAR